MPRIAIGQVILVGLMAGVAAGAEPPEALTIRLVRPDRQLERLLALFEGARAAHPAEALAAWKRATRDPRGLGKASEAAIAALNPDMVPELRALDRATLGLGLDPGDGHVRWFATAPNDDGSLAALATALVLTDGGPEPALGDVAVDRLGPPGSAVSARALGVLALAGSRDDLATALKHAGARPAERPDRPPRLVVRLNPEALAVAGPLPVARRRLIEAVRAGGFAAVEATIGLEGEAAEVAVSGRLVAEARSPTLEPDWLDWLPASGTSAALAVAVDPGPRAWDAAFAWADRVDRADPARAGVAPLRTRLNLLAASARVRPEVDVWPRLRGISAALLAGPEGEVRGALLALHVVDVPAAERLAGQVVPRLAATYLKGSRADERPGDARRLGLVSGRPIEVARRGATVLIGWGESALEAGLAAKEDPARSVGPTVRASWGPTPPSRAGAVWPGRLGDRRLAEAPPVVWEGRDDGTATRDVVRWTGLRGVVRRYLERLPLAPPPDARQPEGSR